MLCSVTPCIAAETRCYTNHMWCYALLHPIYQCLCGVKLCYTPPIYVVLCIVAPHISMFEWCYALLRHVMQCYTLF